MMKGQFLVTFFENWVPFLTVKLYGGRSSVVRRPYLYVQIPRQSNFVMDSQSETQTIQGSTAYCIPTVPSHRAALLVASSRRRPNKLG